MSMFYYMKENDIRNKDEIKLRQINIETFHFVVFFFRFRESIQEESEKCVIGSFNSKRENTTVR